jgi:hypothetical protein
MFLGPPLRHAWDVVSHSKRMLAMMGLLDFAICLPATLYVSQQVHAVAGRRLDALDLAKRYDADFVADLHGRGAGFEHATTTLVFATLAVFFLVRPFVVGAYVGLAASPRRTRFSHFAREGGAAYWKFLRLSVVALAAAWLVSIAAAPLLDEVAEWAKSRTEPTSNRYLLVTSVVVLAALHLVAMVFDYARVGVRLARRPGVLREIGRAALFVLQHPARTLTLYLLSIAIEAAVVLGLGWTVQLADGGYLTTSAIVLLLFQVVATLREATRLFHLAAAWQLRAGEEGDEEREPEVVVAEPEAPDVLRAQLPWNVR